MSKFFGIVLMALLFIVSLSGAVLNLCGFAEGRPHEEAEKIIFIFLSVGSLGYLLVEYHLYVMATWKKKYENTLASHIVWEELSAARAMEAETYRNLLVSVFTRDGNYKTFHQTVVKKFQILDHDMSDHGMCESWRVAAEEILEEMIPQ